MEAIETAAPLSELEDTKMLLVVMGSEAIELVTELMLLVVELALTLNPLLWEVEPDTMELAEAVELKTGLSVAMLLLAETEGEIIETPVTVAELL